GQPVISQPVISQPVISQPVISQPAASQPAASQSGGREAASRQLIASRQAAGEATFDKELADRVHMSLLAGLLSQIGMQDTESKARGSRRPITEFAGARGARFAVSPGSALARKPPRWVVAGELVETSRLWARTVARIE